MKISPEDILLNPSYKVDNYPYFVSGNEETLIKQIEDVLINKFKKNGFIEKERIEKIENYNNSKSLFYNSKLIILKNTADLDKLKIEKIINNGDMLIISSANTTKDKAIKKIFSTEKNYKLILCYKLDQELKIKILNYHLDKNNIVISKDIFWYLLECLDDRYIFFHNELKKICLKKNISYSFGDIKKIINRKIDPESEKLFFNILAKNSEIINLYKSSINSISDFYLFFHNIKFYFNLIINNQTEQDVIKNFPNYLFKHKKAFIIIYKKINSEKKNKLSNLIFKTENLIRKNNNQFESIGLRFLLNFKKIVTVF